ncbi:unnamed protein product [Cladocopium goreaui]|uniref:Uncharacterized protein n=1 Tax=Cladocopium goreaui TaxID=2562237 RepID=A0A9P1CE77_9DINO|nr:unnamed protein product [Cladocopium goreaui]
MVAGVAWQPCQRSTNATATFAPAEVDPSIAKLDSGKSGAFATNAMVKGLDSATFCAQLSAILVACTGQTLRDQLQRCCFL